MSDLRAARSPGGVKAVCRHCALDFFHWPSVPRLFCSQRCAKAPKVDPAERFWSKVDRNGPVPAHCPELGPCWIWTAYTRPPPFSYGTLGVLANGKKKMVRAHCFSWELANGTIPDGLCVLHKCDNPPCVNPDHLRVGTRAENQIDCANKNRIAHGSRNSHAKLRPEDVVAIRKEVRAGVSLCEIARRRGLGYSTVQALSSGRTWRRIADV